MPLTQQDPVECTSSLPFLATQPSSSMLCPRFGRGLVGYAVINKNKEKEAKDASDGSYRRQMDERFHKE
ncbi:hypothetical protein KSD_82570 [Ktedonobacter sp. SOSP1-85]|nr:hypothetical protein KSD_82570 [Ktedonobacter sp. SOSP1-85]